MERDKAEQYVWQITELYDMNDEDGAVDLLNEYANKRVVEELEKLPKQDVPLGATITISYFDVLTRIKELKQD